MKRISTDAAVMLPFFSRGLSLYRPARFTPDDPVIRIDAVIAIAPGATDSGVTLDTLLEGSGIAKEALARPKTAISWRQLDRVLSNLRAEGYTRADFERLGEGVARSRSLSVGRFAGLFVRAEQLLLIGSRLVGPSIFPVVGATVTGSGRRVIIELTLPASFPDATSYFHVCVGTERAMPTLIGDPPAKVKAHISSHRAKLVIDCAPRPRLWVQARRLARSFAYTSEVLRVLHEQESALTASLEAVLASERQLRAIIDGQPDGIVIHRDGVIAYVNPAFTHLVGREVAAIVDTPWRGLFHAEDVMHAAGTLGAPRELRLIHADGSVVPVELSTTEEIVFEGKPAQLVTTRDVTERRALQAQLALADRAASLGLLAAGIAHEINNPLTLVVTSLELASRLTEPSPPLAGPSAELSTKGPQVAVHLQNAREGVERVRRIVQELRIFSNPVEERPERVDLHALLESTLSLVRGQTRDKFAVHLHARPGPAVMGNWGKLGQVVLNLMLNAAQAIEHSGPPDGRIDVRLYTRGRDVILEVEDDGPGMPVEVQRQIFEPFFSTKTAHGGSGLGLPLAERIVGAHGGTIECQSVEGRGTRFRVTLPAAGPAQERTPPRGPGADSEASSKRAERASDRGKRRALIIDDEVGLATALSSLLTVLGWSAKAVSSGEEALELLERETEFDVILCDIRMPVLSGAELFTVLRRAHPELASRVIFMTGGAFQGEVRQLLGDVPNRCLLKPFRLDDLRDALGAPAVG